MEFSRHEYWSGVPLPFPYKVNKMPKYSDSNLTEVLTGSRGFPGGSDGKESTSNAGDLSSIPGSGRFPLEKGMATHISILAWRIPWAEEPGGLQPMGSLRVGMTERLPFNLSRSCIGEGNGDPLHCSCLENPRDRGACWAAVYGVAQSQTRLKRLGSSSSWYSCLGNPMGRGDGRARVHGVAKNQTRLSD